MNAPISSPTTMTSAQAFTTSTMTTGNSTGPQQASPFTGNVFAAAPPPPAPVAQKTPSTDAFIRDLNLVAEAAKRAQMAVLMRDMEGFAIS